MATTEQPATDLGNLVQKLDDIDCELEIQTEYLAKIKMLLTVLVILMIPIVLLVIYFIYMIYNPRLIF